MAKKRDPKPPPTNCKVLKTIQAIKDDIKNGDSLILARKKNCGSPSSMLYKAVSVHPDYQPILIEYGKKTGKSNQYVKRAKSIVNGEIPTFHAWVITTRGNRFYAIHRINTALWPDPKDDLIITTDHKTGMLQIMSRQFTKSIFFKTSELMEEFNKSNLNNPACKK